MFFILEESYAYLFQDGTKSKLNAHSSNLRCQLSMNLYQSSFKMFETFETLGCFSYFQGLSGYRVIYGSIRRCCAIDTDKRTAARHGQSHLDYPQAVSSLSLFVKATFLPSLLGFHVLTVLPLSTSTTILLPSIFFPSACLYAAVTENRPNDCSSALRTAHMLHRFKDLAAA